MALKRIQDLDPAVSVSPENLVEIESDAGSFRCTVQQIVDTAVQTQTNSQVTGAMFGDSEFPHGFKLTKKGKVITLGPTGSWKESRIEGPQVFWDVKIGKYRLVYLGYSGSKSAPSQASIGFATADSPEGPWEEYSSNPVLPPSGIAGSPDSNGCSAPHVWFEGGVYYLYYLGLTQNGLEQGSKTICLATSTDFINWSRRGVVISPMSSTWRANAVWHPNIVKRGDTYYMFFNAGIGAESIGFATSSDLITWTVDDTNSPVVSPGVGWESARVGDPYIWKKGEIWYMSYYAADSSGKSQEGIAWTLDIDFPLGWEKYHGNPVIAVTPGSYDSNDSARGCVLVTPSKLYHWYTTGNGASPPTIEIALATDDTLIADVASVDEVIAGAGISVDSSNPKKPIISATGAVSGSVFIGCKAMNTGAVTVSNQSNIVPLPTNDFDTAGIYNQSTNTFTVPPGYAGKWRISYSCIKNSSTGVLYLFVRKNGSTDSSNIQGSAAGGSGVVYAYKSVISSLNVGDYLTLNCYASSGGTIGSATDPGLATIMEMEYLG